MIHNYPGFKNASGIIPFLINHIPYHTRYFELFAGSAQLYFHKKKALKLNRLTEIDPDVCQKLVNICPEGTVINCSAQKLLQSETFSDSSDFIYLDPPYPICSLKHKKKYYRYVMSDQDHIDLLKLPSLQETLIE